MERKIETQGYDQDGQMQINSNLCCILKLTKTIPFLCWDYLLGRCINPHFQVNSPFQLSSPILQRFLNPLSVNFGKLQSLFLKGGQVISKFCKVEEDSLNPIQINMSKISISTKKFLIPSYHFS